MKILDEAITLLSLFEKKSFRHQFFRSGKRNKSVDLFKITRMLKELNCNRASTPNINHVELLRSYLNTVIADKKTDSIYAVYSEGTRTLTLDQACYHALLVLTELYPLNDVCDSELIDPICYDKINNQYRAVTSTGYIFDINPLMKWNEYKYKHCDPFFIPWPDFWELFRLVNPMSNSPFSKQDHDRLVTIYKHKNHPLTSDRRSMNSGFILAALLEQAACGIQTISHQSISMLMALMVINYAIERYDMDKNKRSVSVIAPEPVTILFALCGYCLCLASDHHSYSAGFLMLSGFALFNYCCLPTTKKDDDAIKYARDRIYGC